MPPLFCLEPRRGDTSIATGVSPWIPRPLLVRAPEGRHNMSHGVSPRATSAHLGTRVLTPFGRQEERQDGRQDERQDERQDQRLRPPHPLAALAGCPPLPREGRSGSGGERQRHRQRTGSSPAYVAQQGRAVSPDTASFTNSMACQNRFTSAFRLLWVVLSRFLEGWEDLAQLMKPATVTRLQAV